MEDVSLTAAVAGRGIGRRIGCEKGRRGGGGGGLSLMVTFRERGNGHGHASLGPGTRNRC